jgi:hypothetical protein
MAETEEKIITHYSYEHWTPIGYLLMLLLINL